MVAQTAPNTQDELKQAWRDSVAIMAQRARDSLGPDYTTRIDKAQAIVLAGDVYPLGEGDYDVQSETDKDLTYEVRQDLCSCKDASNRALHGRCKHVLAIWLYRRALKHTQSTMDSKTQVSAPGGDLPEAPVSVSLKGSVCGRAGTLVTIRGNSVEEVRAKLAEAATLFDGDPEPECKAVTGFGDDSDAPFCETHHTRFFLNHAKNGKSTWWSHRLQDGSFCRYNGKK